MRGNVFVAAWIVFVASVSGSQCYGQVPVPCFVYEEFRCDELEEDVPCTDTWCDWDVEEEEWVCPGGTDEIQVVHPDWEVGGLRDAFPQEAGSTLYTEDTGYVCAQHRPCEGCDFFNNELKCESSIANNWSDFRSYSVFEPVPGNACTGQ
jgi:hypothetical protein